MATTFVYIPDNINPNNYDFTGENNIFNHSTIFNQTQCLIDFANYSSEEKNRIKECFADAESFDTLQEYVIKVRDALLQICSPDYVDLIFMDFDNDENPIYLEEAESYLGSSLDRLCTYAWDFCNALHHSYRKQFAANEHAKLASAIIDHGGNNELVLLLHPFVALSKVDNSLAFCYYSEVSCIWDAMRMLFLTALKDNVTILLCDFCHKFFTPSTRCDEIYCESCRKVTYDTKIKKDTIKYAYRNAYKTQYGRMKALSVSQGYKEIPEHLRKQFRKWQGDATQKMDDCIAGTITIEEMKTAISSPSWLHKKQ